MNFPTSTHRRKWIFESGALDAKRAAAYEASRERVKQLWAEELEGVAREEEWQPLDLEEDLLLQKYYQKKIQEVCRSVLHLPPKVAASAIQLFKRFTLSTSLLEHDAVKLMLTCIYVACKVEESYLNVEDLCTRLSLRDYKGAVLENEVLLLQAVDFDMVIYNAFRPLDGLFASLQEWVGAGREGGAPEALFEGGESRLAEARSAATSAIDALQLSDAPLLHPPGLLALAAMKNGLRVLSKEEGLFATVLHHILLRKRETVESSVATNGGEDVAASVLAGIAAVDKLGMAGAEKLSGDNLKTLDLKLRKCRSPLLNSQSRLSKAAREERRASKVGATRSSKSEQSAKRQRAEEATPA
uniref:Cyclin N-terminal domain-containing protein n=1 Tax=Tetraselmis chuii TaxID=63592 RepID=A0A7S1SZD7_9CHLO|mmetsp:Transcript_36530/g.65365  ORF Transcript_36530/g.65365 Transcript_36530/m.65365 type:complete len:357 (+) Transcript_36530:243-1313(+)